MNMGFFCTIGFTICSLVQFFTLTSSLTNQRDVEKHVRISRAHGVEPPITDWEIGLREATHQALLRDGYTNPSLHDYLFKAPILGKQFNRAFGDIAILARGQLYATPIGFDFVQEPYRNEKRNCETSGCDHDRIDGSKRLVALWTVKRIRHRDENYGHRYEIEYIISPIDETLRADFVTRNGRFDYGIPGHVFVIRSNPRYTNGNQNKFFYNPDKNYLTKPTVTRKSIDFGPDVKTSASTTDPREIQLYRNLINSLAAKTSPSGHRFKIETQDTSPRTVTNRISTHRDDEFTKSTFGIPTHQTQRTTLIQLPTGEIIPITESTSTTQHDQFQLLTPGAGAFQTTPISTNGYHQIPSTDIPIIFTVPPTQLPKTTFHFFAAEDDEDKSTEDLFGTRRYSSRTKVPSRKTTKYDYDDEEIDLFPTLKPTEAMMRKITEVPFRETSPGVNQISPPSKETPATLPYSIGKSTEIYGMKSTKTTQKPTTFATQRTIVTFPIPYTQQKNTVETTTVFPEKSTYSTVNGNEKIMTVTPVQTVPFRNNEESLLSTTGYGYTSTGNNAQTTDNSRTTLIFPSTGIISTTFAPKTESDDRRTTTQIYTTNIETSPGLGNEYISSLKGSTVTTQSYNSAYPSTETQTPTRRYKVKTSQIKDTNDFLVDDISDDNKSLSKNRNIDYTPDDIFGPIEKSKPKIEYQQQSKIYQTDFTTEPTRTVAKTPKIIYSDFFQASTVPPTTSLTQFYAESQNSYITKPLQASTERLPLTSQSYLTSISYKVNKKTTDEIEILPTVKAKLSNVIDHEKLQIFKAELPDDDEEKKRHEKHDKKEFDNIALQLVNHVRSLDLLREKEKNDSKNSIEIKRSQKFKRRNLFVPKSRNSQRRLGV